MFSYRFLISFVLTIVSTNYWLWLPSARWSVVLLVILAVLIKYRAQLAIRGGLSAGILVILQGNLLTFQTEQLFQSAENTTINAQVVSLFKQNRYGYESVIEVRSIDGQKNNVFSLGRVRLATPFKLDYGDQINMIVRIKPIYGRLNMAGFDKEKHLFSQGIIATANYVTDSSYSISSRSSLRSQWYERVSKLTAHLEYSGLLIALSFGVREGIDIATWEGLKASGLIHLVAISGLHIGIAFGIGYVVGNILKRIWPSGVWLPFILAVLLACFYAWLAGFTLPTKRALSMCIAVSVFTLLSIRLSAPKMLLLCLSSALALDPFSSLSSSLWMSFGAVAIVIYCTSRWRRFAICWRKKLLVLVKIQFLLSLLMFPITAYYFNGLSLASFVYNLIFLPWFSFVVVPLLFVALLTSIALPKLALNVWLVVDAAISPVILSSGYSKVFWFITSDDITVYTIVVALFTILLAPFLRAKAIFLISVLAVGWKLTDSKVDEVIIDVLDVGHGLAIVIRQGGGAVIYDTGAAWEGGTMAKSVIIPVLDKIGVDQLEGMIVSHFDSDHSGGYKDIVQRYKPNWVRSSQLGMEHLPCTRGQFWSWKAVDFEVVWPPKLSSRAYNPHSCVIRVSESQTGTNILLTGDVDALSEWLMVRSPKVLKSDILIVPHHGSKTSSTQRFIDAVSPQLAIASLAKGNQWGMPHQTVLKRYALRNIEWVDTGRFGQITITIDSKGWRYDSLRGNRRSPWYRQMLRNGVE